MSIYKCWICLPDKKISLKYIIYLYINIHLAYIEATSDVLYSESAYNCMESVPERATYCPELDEVFKNNAKVVPGVAFTKRPKESQDNEYVEGLLSYYASQNS